MCKKVSGPIDTTRNNEMQTIDEVREHCRFVGKGIEMARCQTDLIVCKL